jgi:hypothetical protein
VHRQRLEDESHGNCPAKYYHASAFLAPAA